MADLEDALSPTWANVVGGPGQPARRGPTRRSTFESPRARPTGSTSGPRRSSSGRAAGTSTSGTSLVDGEPVSASLFDFGLYFFHNARGASCARGSGPVLLPAEAGEPPRGAALERRLRRRAGGARHPARHDPRDRADRDDPGRVRDGRDPLRAARARRGPQRRPLGLHLQHASRSSASGPDMVLPDRAQVTMAVPFMRAYTRAAGADVPPPRRARDRRHGGVHPQPPRARGQRERAGEGARGQGARGRRRLRRHLGRPPGPRAASRPRSSTACSGERPNQKERLREDVVGDRRAARWTCASPAARSPRPACALNVSVGAPVPRRVAARQRRGRDQQPDGGRGHGRDLALPALAVAAPRLPSSTTGDAVDDALYAALRDEELATPRRRGLGPAGHGGGAHGPAGALATTSSSS